MRTRKCDKCRKDISVRQLFWGFEEQGKRLWFVKVCESCRQKSILEHAWSPKQPARKLGMIERLRFYLCCRMIVKDTKWLKAGP